MTQGITLVGGIDGLVAGDVITITGMYREPWWKHLWWRIIRKPKPERLKQFVVGWARASVLDLWDPAPVPDDIQ